MKLGNGQPQDAPMDMSPMGEPMPDVMPQGDMMGGSTPPMDDMQGGAPMPPMDGTQQPGQSDFDTNFDAGVEANEETDPKKFIQQLTGKLSTTLNSYNSENEDEGLNKYVANMIVKAATKNMDDAGKKAVIKAINTSSNPEPVDDEEPETEPDNMEGMDGAMPEEQPLQERVITKKQLREMAIKRKK